MYNSKQIPFAVTVFFSSILSFLISIIQFHKIKLLLSFVRFIIAGPFINNNMLHNDKWKYFLTTKPTFSHH